MPSNVFNVAANLINFKSVSPNHAGSLNYVSKFLEELGFKIDFLNIGKTTNIIATLGNKGPILSFAGHVDVVPPGDITKWSSDPFTLLRKDNKLYGRGIADMKGAVASFLCAIESFLLKIKKDYLNLTLMVLLTSDEESSGEHGTIEIVKFLEQKNIKIDYCILGEPTSISNVADTIKIGRRGSLNCHLEVIGKMGHIAYPHLCKNPIHSFSDILNQLINIEWDDGTEHFSKTSLQFSNINSGTGVGNIIPGNLTAVFNIRYNDLHTFDSITNKITSVIKFYSEKNNVDYTIEYKNSGESFITKSGKLVETATKIIKDKFALNVNLSTSGGTSDGRFLKKICTEFIELGLSNHSIHQIDEFVQEDELIKLTTLYELLINEFNK